MIAIGVDDCVYHTASENWMLSTQTDLNNLKSAQSIAIWQWKNPSLPDLFVGEAALIFSYRYVKLIWVRFNKTKKKSLQAFLQASQLAPALHQHFVQKQSVMKVTEYACRLPDLRDLRTSGESMTNHKSLTKAVSPLSWICSCWFPIYYHVLP